MKRMWRVMLMIPMGLMLVIKLVIEFHPRTVVVIEIDVYINYDVQHTRRLGNYFFDICI